MPKPPPKKKPTAKQVKFFAVLNWIKRLDSANLKVTTNLHGTIESFTSSNWGHLGSYVLRVSNSAFVPVGGIIIYYKPPKTTLTVISGFAVTGFYELKILDPEILNAQEILAPGHIWVNASDAYRNCPIRRTSLAAPGTYSI